MWDFISDTLYSPQVQSLARRAFGGTGVEVRQIVRDLDGSILSDKTVRHIFSHRGRFGQAL
jgi:hypothetical protein